MLTLIMMGKPSAADGSAAGAGSGRVDSGARIVVPRVTGVRRICVKAVDVFGNESVVCETVNR